MKPLRTVWVGYGQMGRSLAGFSRALPWLQTVGVVDSRAEGLARAGEDLGLAEEQLHERLSSALRVHRPAAVVINTPSELHYAQAAMALRAGAHVLVAKPAVSTVGQALRLQALSREVRRKVAVGQQLRFNRHYRAVAALVASGALGRISHIHLLNSKPRPDPQNLGEMPHPAMLEMACHHFDSLLALVPRARPLAITAQGYRPRWSPYKGHSMVDAMVELSGGVRVLYHGGFDAQAPCYELRIEGTQGVLRARGEHMSAAHFSYELAPALGQFSPVDLEAQVPAGGAWGVFMTQWQDWLQRGKEPSFSLRKNFPVLALLQAGMASIDRGRRIDLLASQPFSRLLGA